MAKAESATTVPATAGEYAIEVALDTLTDTYDVTVEDNRVASTALVVDEDYVLYTTGKGIIFGATAASAYDLDADYVFVTQTMTNGQVLKADGDSVAWGTVQATVSEATSGGAMDIAVDVNEGTTTTIYAKYVGNNVTTDYKREVYTHSFTPITNEVTGATITATAVTLKLDTYSADNKVEATDVTGIKVAAVTNSGFDAPATSFNNETEASAITWNIGTPSIAADKKVGDSVSLTVHVYNGTTEIATKTVVADLVANS